MLLCSGLVAVLSGCATTHRGNNSVTSAIAEPTEPQVSAFGSIAVAQESKTASFGFQKAKGKLGSAKEAVWDSATLGLSAPGAGVIVTGTILNDEFGCANGGGDPIFLAAVAGAAGGATLIGTALVGPYVGLRGLILSLKSVSPAELLEREATLTNGLRQMAAQQTFQDVLLQTGHERIEGGFVSGDQNNHSQLAMHPVADAIFEARVEDLRLERTGSSEASYLLHIKTCARLVRVSDGRVCFEQHAEYRSGTALFLDWTSQGAVESVAETGYKALARYYVDQLLAKKDAKL